MSNSITASANGIISNIKVKRPKFDILWKEYQVVIDKITQARATATNPNFQDTTAVYNYAGGNVKKLHQDDNLIVDPLLRDYQNSCAIKISIALNMAGYKIKTGTVNTKYDIYREKGDPKICPVCIMRVIGVIHYIEAVWGSADNGFNPYIFKKGEDNSSAFLGKKGVIAFQVEGWRDAFGHVTLWNGSMCGDELYSGHDYFNFDQVEKIFFWELK